MDTAQSKTLNRKVSPSRRCGAVALIIVVGLLSIVTIAAVSFARAMLTSRLSAHSFADQVAAEELCKAALSRAMESVRNTCAGYAYPCWINNPPCFCQDALCSWTPNYIPVDTLLEGEASNHIPRALWNDASAAASNATWIPVLSNKHGNVIGRIAFLVINCSGLLDANIVGGTRPDQRTDPSEVDLSSLPDLDGTPDYFYSNRFLDKQYETVPDLGVNEALKLPVSNLFVYSYDPNSDVFFESTDHLGTASCDLREKTWVNAGSLMERTSYDAYLSSTTDLAYFFALSNTISSAGLSNSAALAWNIMNYTDPNRIPQSDDPSPWISGPVEDVPLINEIIVRQVASKEAFLPSNEYEVVVELWYPFVPRVLQAEDAFELQVAVSDLPIPPHVCTSAQDILSFSSSNWSFRTPISYMAYKTDSEFVCFTSPPSARIFFTDGTNFLPLNENRPIWLMVRVAQQTTEGLMPVDQAMSATNFFCVTKPSAWSVNDPRMNGSEEYWSEQIATPGTVNQGCECFADGSDLPIFHRDGPMLSIAELGHIKNKNHPWQTLDIMSDSAAVLLDRMTTSGTPTSKRGRVSIGTAQRDVLKCLFHGITVGWSNAVASELYGLTQAGIKDLAETIIENGPYLNFADLFSTNIIKQSFIEALDPAAPPSDFFLEGVLRAITELITFRQNIFTVIAAAQVLGSDGQTILSERRAMAVIARDSYTGQWFVRNQKWLQR